jgi:hypothetical protein
MKLRGGLPINYVFNSSSIQLIICGYVSSTCTYVLCLEIERFLRVKFVESYDWMAKKTST